MAAVRWRGRSRNPALPACALAGMLMLACHPPLIPDTAGVLGEPPCAIAPETPTGGRLFFAFPVIANSAPLHVTVRVEGTGSRLILSEPMDITKTGKQPLRLPINDVIREGTVLTYHVFWKGDEIIRDSCLVTAMGMP